MRNVVFVKGEEINNLFFIDRFYCEVIVFKEARKYGIILK
jgi:hypothetical protein